MNRFLIILSVLFAFACSANVEGGTEPQATEPVCTAVCAFANGTCDSKLNTFTSTDRYSDDMGCWVRTAACFPIGTPKECIPEDCWIETGYNCP